jgi:hypothetical protein
MLATSLGTATLLSLPVGAQLTVVGNDRLFQSELGGLVEEGDYFGWALAAGDFNGDGYHDLAVGAPGEDVGALGSAGAVFVAYGGAGGMGTGAPLNQILHQDVAGVAEVAEPGDRFGAAVASGDVNGDGFADLAVGSPGEALSGFAGAGAVHLFLGSAGGLVPAGSGHLLHAGSFGGGLTYASDAELGYALVICDRNADDHEDLVIGIPSPGVESRPGALIEVFGTATGAATAGAILREAPEGDGGDEFGAALACGRLDAAAGDDLLVGAPEALSADGERRVGEVWELSEGGAFDRSGRGSATGDRMGDAVVVGRFNGGAFDIPLWSAPGGDHLLTLNNGEAQTRQFILRQEGGGAGDTAEPFDYFGQALAGGDFNGDGYDEAVFGTPREDTLDGTPEATPDAGLVQVLQGPIGSGPAQPFQAAFAWGAQFGFEPEADDRFGSSLAVGDFDGDGIDDLAIGAPFAQWNLQDFTGIVQLLFGSQSLLFADGFETGGTGRWSSTAP